MKRIILTTGGTGGHIFPALAVAEALRQAAPSCEILFVGGEHGPERRWAERAGLTFAALPARGVLGRGLKSAGSVVWLARSLFKAWKLLRGFRPDVVLGLGGYAGFSCVLAASFMGIPTAIHEQNSVPGVTNRILARRVNRILVSFAGMDAQSFADKTVVVTGNPIRGNIRALRDREPTRGRNVLVVGGSQGAAALNRIMVREVDSFRSQGIRIWHQTGRDEYEKVRAVYAEHYPEARVDAFIDSMEEAYAFADLVICRAGATTIAELTAAGKPSILVPFPYATHDHQLKNARFLEAGGAAMVVQQSHLEEMSLAAAVGDLFGMPERLTKMGRAARDMGMPDAGERVVTELQNLAGSATRKR